MDRIMKAILLIVLIITFVALSVSCLSGCRETKVRSSHGRRNGVITRFVD